LTQDSEPAHAAQALAVLGASAATPATRAVLARLLDGTETDRLLALSVLADLGPTGLDANLTRRLLACLQGSEAGVRDEAIAAVRRLTEQGVRFGTDGSLRSP